MRIFGISIVKNEEDIIEYSLTKSSEWAEKIFVLDNGSDDKTWEKVHLLAKVNQKIVPWQQCHEPFHDGLRARVFNEFKHLVEDGDWWCARLDADEFYIDNPVTFLMSRVKSYYHVVCSKHIQYRLTQSDLEFLPDGLAISDRLKRIRFFDKMATSEVRFFKHRKGLLWEESQTLPAHVGLVCPERILLRHYQFRSIQQIQKRIDTRIQTRKNYPHIFPHVMSANPMEYLAKESDCVLDTGEISSYKKLPLLNNKVITYRWWVFLIRRMLHSIGIFP